MTTSVVQVRKISREDGTEKTVSLPVAIRELCRYYKSEDKVVGALLRGERISNGDYSFGYQVEGRTATASVKSTRRGYARNQR